jgi:hypothetical protein
VEAQQNLMVERDPKARVPSRLKFSVAEPTVEPTGDALTDVRTPEGAESADSSPGKDETGGSAAADSPQLTLVRPREKGEGHGPVGSLTCLTCGHVGPPEAFTAAGLRCRACAAGWDEESRPKAVDPTALLAELLEVGVDEREARVIAEAFHREGLR